MPAVVNYAPPSSKNEKRLFLEHRPYLPTTTITALAKHLTAALQNKVNESECDRVHLSWNLSVIVLTFE